MDMQQGVVNLILAMSSKKNMCMCIYHSSPPFLISSLVGRRKRVQEKRHPLKRSKRLQPWTRAMAQLLLPPPSSQPHPPPPLHHPSVTGIQEREEHKRHQTSGVVKSSVESEAGWWRDGLQKLEFQLPLTCFLSVRLPFPSILPSTLPLHSSSIFSSPHSQS